MVGGRAEERWQTEPGGQGCLTLLLQCQACAGSIHVCCTGLQAVSVATWGKHGRGEAATAGSHMTVPPVKVTGYHRPQESNKIDFLLMILQAKCLENVAVTIVTAGALHMHGMQAHIMVPVPCGGPLLLAFTCLLVSVNNRSTVAI